MEGSAVMAAVQSAVADVRIIDTDSHIIEPADLWTSRLPASWGDDRLHVQWNDRWGAEVWMLGDTALTPAWQAANWGWGRPYPSSPPTFDDCHPATVDPRERVKAMDASGVRAALLYPNIGGVELNRFGWSAEVSAAHVSAYNDFQLEWASAAPGRLIPMAVVPYWDVRRAVAEIERISGLGFGGIVTTGAPHLHNEPFLSDRHWDAIWSAAVDGGLPVSFHVGNGDQNGLRTQAARYAVERSAFYVRGTTGAFLDNGHQVTDLLLSGVLARHPELRVVSVESGLGWIPFVLESCDYHFTRARVWKDHPEFGDLLPSDLFRRQVYANYWFERLEQWHIDAIGVDHILFETDFPHPTCLYGDEVSDALRNGLDSMPTEVQEKILWGNACELYGIERP